MVYPLADHFVDTNDMIHQRWQPITPSSLSANLLFGPVSFPFPLPAVQVSSGPLRVPVFQVEFRVFPASPERFDYFAHARP